MVNLSYRLVQDFRIHNHDAGIHDLKAYFRGTRYVLETIKMLPKKLNRVLLDRIFALNSFVRAYSRPSPSITTS
jgi:putative transposase